MTYEDIIRLAQATWHREYWKDVSDFTAEFELFGRRIEAASAEAEREACEIAIEELPPDADRSDCAAAIRARGQA